MRFSSSSLTFIALLRVVIAMPVSTALDEIADPAVFLGTGIDGRSL
jgi:hypothetical protein